MEKFSTSDSRYGVTITKELIWISHSDTIDVFRKLNNLFGYAEQNPISLNGRWGLLPKSSGCNTESDQQAEDQACSTVNQRFCDVAMVECRLRGGDMRLCFQAYQTCLDYPDLHVIFPGGVVKPPFIWK